MRDGEWGAHLVALLGVGGALGHDHQGGAASAAGHGGDVEALLPALHDPVLGQEVHAAQLVHLGITTTRRVRRAQLHCEVRF